MESDNPFDQCGNAFSKREPVTSESNHTVNYMLLRALSMSAAGYYGADIANKWANGAPPWATRLLAHTLTPNMPAPRPLYIKKQESKLTDKDKRIVGELCKLCNLSTRHGTETYLMLKEQQFNFDAAFGQKIAGKAKK